MGWVSTFNLLTSLMVVAGAADVGVEHRGGVSRPRLHGLTIELVIEDRAHRAVGQGADLDGPCCCRLDTFAAERAYQAHDAEAGAEPLLGMWPALQDQLA